MKKVIYSVSRYRKGDIEKNTGIGYITDRDLVIACISKNGKTEMAKEAFGWTICCGTK